MHVSKVSHSHRPAVRAKRVNQQRSACLSEKRSTQKHPFRRKVPKSRSFSSISIHQLDTACKIDHTNNHISNNISTSHPFTNFHASTQSSASFRASTAVHFGWFTKQNSQPGYNENPSSSEHSFPSIANINHPAPVQPRTGIGGLFSLFKARLQGDENPGILVGRDPSSGHRFYEIPTNRPSGIPSRRVEYITQIPEPDQLHILWEGWLRFSRLNPPTDEDIAQYDAKMVKYHENVRMAEERDAKLRLEEQLMRKLSGEAFDQSQLSAQNMLQQLQHTRGSDSPVVSDAPHQDIPSNLQNLPSDNLNPKQ